MRKDLFIARVKKSESFFWHFNDDAILLKEFLASLQFKKLSDGYDVSENDLKKFLAERAVSDSRSASVLKFFRDLEAQYNKNIKKEKRSYGKDALGEQLLPAEVWEKEISKHFEPESAALWAQTSSSFYRIAYPKVAEYWQNKLLEAGCPAHLLRELIESGLVSDYKRLYNNYCRFLMRRNQRIIVTTYLQHEGSKNVAELEQLLILSGELSAISYALGNKKQGFRHFENDQDGWDVLDYIALTGNVDAMKLFMDKYHVPHMIEGAYHKKYEYWFYHGFLSCAALSGDLEAVKYALSVWKSRDRDWQYKGYNEMMRLLSRALQVNNLEMINYLYSEILDHFKEGNIYEAIRNADGEFSFNAARSGNVDVIHFLFKPGNLMSGYFGKLRASRDKKIYDEINCALYGACLSGRIDAVECVLDYAKKYNADLFLLSIDKEHTIHTESYHGALAHAIKSGNVDVFNRIATEVFKSDSLLSADEFFEKALLTAAQVGGSSIFMYVMSLISPDNLLDPNELFYCAAAAGSCSIMKYLLDKFSTIDFGKTMRLYERYDCNLLELAISSHDPATIIFVRKELTRREIYPTNFYRDILEMIEYDKNALAAYRQPLDKLAPEEPDQSPHLKK